MHYLLIILFEARAESCAHCESFLTRSRRATFWTACGSCERQQCSFAHLAPRARGRGRDEQGRGGRAKREWERENRGGEAGIRSARDGRGRTLSGRRLGQVLELDDLDPLGDGERANLASERRLDGSLELGVLAVPLGRRLEDAECMWTLAPLRARAQRISRARSRGREGGREGGREKTRDGPSRASCRRRRTRTRPRAQRARSRPPTTRCSRRPR